MEPSRKEIALIHTPALLSKGRVGSVTGAPPLGLAYLAASLRDRGFRVSVLDAFGECPLRGTDLGRHVVFGLTIPEILDRIPGGAAVVGLSCMFSNEWFYARELALRIKERFPGAVLVLGGEHATALPRFSMESCPAADFLIRGEGETRLPALLEHLFSGKGRLEDIPGLVYRKGPEVVLGGAWDVAEINAHRIRELDRLPRPAWDLFPIENYLAEGIATISAKGKRVMPIISSRGCPFSCKFCSNNDMWGTRYVVRECADVVAEIRELKDRFRITGFDFHDLTTIMKKEWILEFCRRLDAEAMGLEWNVPATRMESLDDEVLDALRRAGCTNICLTPDSGSEFQLRDMKKRVDLGKMTACIRSVLRGGLVLKLNLVIGFPNEGHRSVWATLWYGIRMSLAGVSSVLFYRFVPYPGSEYFRQLQDSGRIAGFGPGFEEFLSTNTYNELSEIKSFTPHISDRALRVYLLGGYALGQAAYFAVRPWKVLKMVRRVLQERPESQMDLLLINLLRRIRG